MSSLRPNDLVVFLSASPGFGYAEKLDRSFLVLVHAVTEDGEVEAQVVEDSYNRLPEDDERAEWRVPEGETVVLHGTCTNGEDPSQGFLYVGRQVDYSWGNHRRYGLILQEISVADPAANVQMTMWDTDPTVFREEPAYLQEDWTL